MGWQAFSRERLIHRDPTGFVVIRPEVRPDPVPLFCSLCALMMRTADDAHAWRESGCCAKCSMKWVEPDRARWARGWRPDPHDVQADVAERRAIPIGVKLDGLG